MLELILDKQILLILMGVAAGIGVLSKCIVNIALRRLVKAAGNMNKSTHALMRLIRAKFEHACMISDRVQNVSVFVEKYLHEYKILGFRLHSLRRMETGAGWLCLAFGFAAAFVQYYVNGMGELVLRYGAMGAIMAVLLFLFHLTTDEKYHLEVAKNYMVDYLENVCAHRCEKMYRKDVKAMEPPKEQADSEYEEYGDYIPDGADEDMEEETAAVRAVRRAAEKAPEEANPMLQETDVKAKKVEEPGPERAKIEDPTYPTPREEVPSPSHTPEITPPIMPPPLPVPPIQAMEEEIRTLEAEVQKEKKPLSKEVLIREILEEFLA